MAQYGHLCFFVEEDGDLESSRAKLDPGKLMPRRASLVCALRRGPGYVSALFEWPSSVSARARAREGNGFAESRVPSSSMIRPGLATCTPLAVVVVAAAKLSAVPKLDILTGLVCKLLSPWERCGIEMVGAIAATAAFTVFTASGASWSRLMPLMGLPPKRALKALRCGFGLCCWAKSLSSNFRFFCSAISAAAVSTTGEFMGDNSDLGEVSVGDLRMLIPDGCSVFGLAICRGRFRGFAGSRNSRVTALLGAVAGDAMDDGVGGSTADGSEAVLRVGGGGAAVDGSAMEEDMVTTVLAAVFESTSCRAEVRAP